YWALRQFQYRTGGDSVHAVGGNEFRPAFCCLATAQPALVFYRWRIAVLFFHTGRRQPADACPAAGNSAIPATSAGISSRPVRSGVGGDDDRFWRDAVFSLASHAGGSTDHGEFYRCLRRLNRRRPENGAGKSDVQAGPAGNAPPDASQCGDSGKAVGQSRI